MTDLRHKREYPEGQRRELTDEWRALVLRRLLENSSKTPRVVPYDKASLARLLNGDKGGIGRMLLPSSHPKALNTSGWVDPICEILDIPPPTVGISADDDEIMRLLGLIGAHNKSAVLALLRGMAAGTQGKRTR